MTQKTNNKAVENTPANEQIETVQSNAPAVQHETFEDAPTITLDKKVDFASLVEASSKLGELKEIITLTAEYLELKKEGDNFIGVFIGEQTMSMTDKATGELKTMPAARFLINKKVFINSGAALVSELKRANIQIGTPLKVTFTEKKGNTKIYSITLLG